MAKKVDSEGVKAMLESYSLVDKDGFAYTLNSGHWTRAQIKEIKEALAQRMEIPNSVKKQFEKLLDQALLAQLVLDRKREDL